MVSRPGPNENAISGGGIWEHICYQETAEDRCSKQKTRSRKRRTGEEKRFKSLAQRILIVDDEQYAHSAIERLIWSV
jgi:hypothetical protein